MIMPDNTTTLSPPSRRSLKRFRSLLLIPLVAIVVGSCYLYARFIEVNWIKVKRLDIPLKRLPKEFEGFKIAHLSDLHIDAIGKRERKLPAMVNSLAADAIFITGDFSDTKEGEPIAASIVAQLKSKYGMWGVLGNWDSSRTNKACKEAGVKMLLTQTDMIKIGNGRIGIIGLKYDDALRVLTTEGHREIISGLKAKLPDGIPLILLEHEPRIIWAAQDEGIDLVLSGHTHGGQVRIPFGPAIETPSDMGIWYSKGLYKFKDTYLHISPGIGLEPGSDYIKVRFSCRPEITLIVLHDDKGVRSAL
jgi:predicted MPP superfamily phosphohydrolase